ncbi:dTDP-3-amino-3,4, 6-trideoxy-alpha-D-glucopyranose [bacterium BMS3Abin04]|nr:dTDP-3-amino-3,4, 6-trideoxy-alpha-D-glucopyranose [bacterium BMS3Abin04]
MKNEWFKDWFASQDYLDVYRHRNDNDAKTFLKTILNIVDIPRNAKVLDAACGAGRYSENLAKLYYNVVGFDLSMTLLKIALKKFKSLNYSGNFFRSDIRKVCLKSKFDLILLLFTSFGYFENDEDNFLFPETAFNLLNENGYFVLDFFNSKYVRNNLIPKSEKIIGNKQIIENRIIEDNRVKKKILIKTGDDEREFNESVKLYGKKFILDKLSEIGFHVYKILGDYEGSEFDENKSTRLILILRK